LERPHKAGFVAIIGAPNAGKSTLLNYFLKEKLAIVAAKPQTTRHKILGIITEENFQVIFWDTPGYHVSERLLNKEMMSRTLSALTDADVVLWLVDGRKQGRDHEAVRELILKTQKEKLLIAISKADLVEKTALDEIATKVAEEIKDCPVFQVSAKTGKDMDRLKSSLVELLPESGPFFPEDVFTDQPMRLIAAEFVREAVFRLLRNELPYSTAVTIDEYREPAKSDSGLQTYIAATIHVEKENQKGIMIGNRGLMLKEIGTRARLALEKMIEGPVFLKLFVRVTKDWSKKKSSIHEFGYGDKS
jgi:GTP-binding protein Era